MLGQQVRSLYSGVLAAGEHRLYWDGMTDSGVELSSGIYYLRLLTETGGRTRKMTLLR